MARRPVHGPPSWCSGGAVRRTCLCAEQLFINNNKDSCDGDRAVGRDRFRYIVLIILPFTIFHYYYYYNSFAAVLVSYVSPISPVLTRPTDRLCSTRNILILLLLSLIYFPFIIFSLLPTSLSRLAHVP